MGYPMTWRRLITRNALHDGDYNGSPQAWAQSGGVVAWSMVEQDSRENLLAFVRALAEQRDRDAEAMNRRLMLFAGDLRRLERDTVDERAICQEIARKLDFDPEMVAAVLREWLAT